MSLGTNIQYLRKLNKLTQEQFAEKMNITRQTVSRWESDEVTPELNKLVEICSVFSCKLDELVREDMTSKDEIYSDVTIKKMPIGGVFMFLETERLILRDIRMEDIQEYYERLYGDGDVCRYLLFDPHQDIGESLQSIQEILQHYEEGRFYRWGITQKEEGSLIGVIGLVRIDETTDTCSFAYLLGCDYWNQGYGTELLKAVFRFAFEELEVERILADHMSKNVASGKAMAKAGMKHIGTETGKYEKLGIFHDAEVYEIRSEKNPGLTANDYQRQAMALLNPALSRKDVLINGVMGLCGEAGECIDLVKKHLHQGHELDTRAMARELGDVAWYLAETAWALDIPLESILRGNLEKLKKRYPQGFDSEKSQNR